MLTQFKLFRLVSPIPLISLIAGLASCSTQTAPSVSLNGAGASFPTPLYELWFDRYHQQNPQVEVSYKSVGSGAGIEKFLNQEVDFSSTDVPLTAQQIAQFPDERGELIQVPIASSAIVLAYNLQDVEELRLSREAYCGIATGEITNWNDAAIARDNPEVSLPDLPITFVHRSDNSGTTFNFTNHLDQVCPDWTAGVGQTVDWTVGNAAPGNAGVAATIEQTQGAIGYTGFAYAERSHIPMATLENKAGFFIEPLPNAAEDATENIETTRDLVTLLPDPESADAYPIIGLTYLLLYENYPDPAQKEALQDLIEWALMEDGRMLADATGYAPLSRPLAAKVIDLVNTKALSERK
ncbi:phosphate ABC transporter substrate-binding protein PstS [Leptolyngbya sp. FACHB-541]|uniref:phosphate ABC transporter substrate-binding protein PstS n=1 Tax=Leptolyngbya sp. FACHB-541 TaxID=2692810 RepID=UPI00168207D9|nr:phosphate ABC transporter substrate-binding protein PstS [Leptolyngbya sp. FACHB-541]MBD1998580.1 phosphate ABC transporter substrate-binding protein PstS [Leptolyngbya sp. FACHB-541]